MPTFNHSVSKEPALVIYLGVDPGEIKERACQSIKDKMAIPFVKSFSLLISRGRRISLTSAWRMVLCF
jgi:hypothetical protein